MVSVARGMGVTGFVEVGCMSVGKIRGSAVVVGAACAQAVRNRIKIITTKALVRMGTPGSM
jgi:hypothetical protein